MINKLRPILFFLFCSIGFLFFSCKSEEQKIQNEEVRPNPFNLAIKNLIEVKDTIQADETLSDLLTPHGVSQQKIHDIELKALNVFPLSKFQSGKELYIYAKWDSVETVKYLVYVVDPTAFVVIDLRDSVNVYKAVKPTTAKIIEAKGEITSGLIVDLQKLGFDNEVGFNTADVFESRIDFEQLQPSDTFDIFFEQIYVEGKPVKIGKIFSAKINHKKKDYYAFLFEKEKAGNYYDEKGNSLAGMFLTAPIKFRYRISSRFSRNRYHPVLHRTKAHLGTDYAAPYGTPIQSVANGVVLDASYTGGNGNYVKIKHNGTYTTQYLHMSRFAKGIRRGAKVNQGQIIGYVGSTGLATGPHVCFRFWKNGKQVDPLRERFQASIPLSKNLFPEFAKVKDEWMKKFM